MNNVFIISWIKGNCKRNKRCNGAHGEKELTAWNEHLEKMKNKMITREKEDNKRQKDNDSAGKNKAPIKDKIQAPRTNEVGC